jgi:ATP-dependent helicase/nuclease subunit B
MAVSGYVPVALEVDREAPFSADWPEPLQDMKLHGRMDRIDRRPADNRLRVIDYKFKFGAQPATQDKDLYRSALRGQRLQPPFYYLLGKRASGESQSPAPEVEAKFYYIAPRWREGPLVSESFGPEGLAGQLGVEVKKTVAQLAAGIRDGRFFLQRGPACSYCEVAEICRKNHPPSLWRTENDPVTAPHRELRNKEAGKP